MLLEAIKEHQETFAKENRPTRVLIIHDGEPSQPDTVKQILMDTANFVSSSVFRTGVVTGYGAKAGGSRE